MCYLWLLSYNVPEVVVEDFKDTIIVVDVALNTACFLVQFSNEAIPYFWHHATKGAEDISFVMSEVKGRDVTITVFKRWQPASLLSFLFFFLHLFLRHTTRNETASEPEAIVDDGEDLIHSLNIAEPGIQLGVNEENAS